MHKACMKGAFKSQKKRKESTKTDSLTTFHMARVHGMLSRINPFLEVQMIQQAVMTIALKR